MLSKVDKSMVDGLDAALDLKADATALTSKADTSVTDGLDTRVTALEGATPKFTKEYVSGELTVSNAGTGTLAHSLGAVPKFVQVRFVCKTAELNYAIGDEIVWGMNYQAFDKGVSILLNSTDVVYRYAAAASPLSYVDKTTGAVNSLTNANWRMVVRAWA